MFPRIASLFFSASEIPAFQMEKEDSVAAHLCFARVKAGKWSFFRKKKESNPMGEDEKFCERKKCMFDPDSERMKKRPLFLFLFFGPRKSRNETRKNLFTKPYKNRRDVSTKQDYEAMGQNQTKQKVLSPSFSLFFNTRRPRLLSRRSSSPLSLPSG